MIEQIYNYFTIETLYYWVNLGVLPFWLILIFFSNTKFCRIFVTSIFPFLILSGAYIFILYKSYLNSYDFISNFNLYVGLDNLKSLFSDDFFIIMFWIHFISINLFTGGWIVKDSQRFAINKLFSATCNYISNWSNRLINLLVNKNFLCKKHKYI